MFQLRFLVWFWPENRRCGNFLCNFPIFLFQPAEMQISSQELLGNDWIKTLTLHDTQFNLNFYFYQWQGDTIEWISMDGTAIIFWSFLLWRFSDKWSLCLDGGTLFKNVRLFWINFVDFVFEILIFSLQTFIYDQSDIWRT